ncbi:hypothetical protein ACXM2N_00675 [Corynebacterium sp. ZY180755]
MSVRSSKTAGRDFPKAQRCLPFAVGCAMITALSGCGNYVDAHAEGISAVSRAPDGGYSYHVYSCEDYKTGGSKVLASERAARIEDLQKALLMLERGSSDTPAPEPSR